MIRILLIIIAIGLFFRFYKFEQIPFGLNHDGAQDALQSIYLIDDLPVYHPYLSGGSGETLFKYYLGFIIKSFGATPTNIKFACTLISFLTIPFFYFLVKEISDRRHALFSTFLLAISGWHIIMGKTVWRAITTPFFEIITFLTFFKAIHQKNNFYYILSGIFLGLTLNTYNGARSVIIFCFLILFYLILSSRKYWLGSCLFVISFVIVSLPLIKYTVNNWDQFNSRLDSLSVFNRIKTAQNLSPLWENTKKSLFIFNVRANGDDFFTSQPLLDSPVSWLFILGLIICLIKIKKPLSKFLLLGISINLLPGFISIPNGNRNIATMPFVYLIAGLGLKQIWQSANDNFRSKLPSTIIVAFICILGLLNTYQIYFSKYRREIWGFYPETTIVGNFMKDKLNDYDFFLTDNYPRDALTFLTYKNGDPFKKYYTWFENKNDFLTVNQNTNKGIIFIMFNLPDNYIFLDQLKQKYRHGYSYELYYNNGITNRSAALVFQVPKNETK